MKSLSTFIALTFLVAVSSPTPSPQPNWPKKVKHDGSLPTASSYQYPRDECQHIYQSKVSIRQKYRTANFLPNALTNYLIGLLPFNDVVDDDKSRNYHRVTAGIHKLWRCVNRLAMEGYEIHGLKSQDLKSFYELGDYRVRVSPNPLEILASAIIHDPRLVDTSLPLKLIRHAVPYIKDPEYHLRALTRRLIPTNVTGLTHMNYEEEQLYDWTYHRVRDEEEFQTKSHRLSAAFETGVVALKTRIPQAQVLPFLDDFLTWCFQADNEVLLRRMFSKMPDLKTNTAICTELTSLKKTFFGTKPNRRFPRIMRWYEELGCTPLEDPAQFNQLPTEVIGHIANKIENIRDIAHLKAVNRELNGLLPRIGAESCVNFIPHIRVNQSSKTATFKQNFLTDYLEDLLPDGYTIREELTDEYYWVQKGLRGLWQCIDSLSKSFSVEAFSDEDYETFWRIGRSRGAPFDERCDPVNIFIVEIVNNPIRCTSVPLSLIRSGAFEEEHLVQLVWSLMPTRKHLNSFVFSHKWILDSQFGALNPYDFFNLEDQLYPAFHHLHIGDEFFLVGTETELESRTLELFNAFKVGILKCIKMTAAETELRLDSFLSIISYVTKTAFSADNHIFLYNVTRKEFLRNTANELGLLDYIDREPPIILDVIVEVAGDSLLRRTILQRLTGDVSDKAFLKTLKQDQFFEQAPWNNFPTIESWYQQL